MRLLQRLPSGGVQLTGPFADDEVPEYAILSHRWEGAEVDFEDIAAGRGQNKAGYAKIAFCADQAARDNLEYFWVDTCCINKAYTGEHQKAIRSMFRWYQRAKKCYVYLCDVSTKKRASYEEDASSTWERSLQASVWFTRGWTLQELLAPEAVEFFSRDRVYLGDKHSLQEQIHYITGVDLGALQGKRLSSFSYEERFCWAERRETKFEEDRVYSLLGIFDVDMSIDYGEGRAPARQRLQAEIDRQTSCIRDLRNTNPGDDKRRIEDTKGGLLHDAYQWILKHGDFRQWLEPQQEQLLWIRGDPGKGKTMLLCGIVNELEKTMLQSDNMSYFFCQAADSRINNATSVLRGLLYMLLDQQPSLASHIQRQHNHAGKTLFEDVNSWVVVSDVFSKVLQDSRLRSTVLVVDALDECTSGLQELLGYISQRSSLTPRVKWLVSSRNWPPIEEHLHKIQRMIPLRLELNVESVSEGIRTYIEHKVGQLAKEKGYDKLTQDTVLEYLSSNADGTFLWVALVCQNLRNLKPRHVKAKLKDFPPDLDGLYERMTKQIDECQDAALCKQLLAAVTVVYRPLTLGELGAVTDLPAEINDNQEELAEVIRFCGSILTIRNDTIYFVHQSAKDYLIDTASHWLFPSGKEAAHRSVFLAACRSMSGTLKRNVYGLDSVVQPVEHIDRPDPDPLAGLRYPCVHWVDHFIDTYNNENTSTGLQDEGRVSEFVKGKYLYWLEALSLCQSMSNGVLAMARLDHLLQTKSNTPAFSELIHDAYRFIMYHKQGIQLDPLQAYSSALLFSPSQSLVKRCFQGEEPNWMTIVPSTEDQWSACLQTLEGHVGPVYSVAFSPDSTRLASGSKDRTVKVWDAGSGACLQTLEGHHSSVTSVAFSLDSTRLVSGSGDGTVKVWDAGSGACPQTLESHGGSVESVAFSPDSTRLASGSRDRTVKVWDAGSGACLQTLKGHGDS
ncbi:hypothetical protein LTS12_025331, partial [Elasticomyces elasticus]